MKFGFTLKPDHSIEETLELTRRAEALGFEYGWLFDSHVLWRDPYPLLTLMIGATSTMRFGTCVTNPATREPSVTASTPVSAPFRSRLSNLFSKGVLLYDVADATKTEPCIAGLLGQESPDKAAASSMRP